MFAKIFIITTTIVLSGCGSSSIPVVSEADVLRAQIHWKNVTFVQLNADRDLYIKKCSGCHSLYLPNQYNDSTWNSILPIMNVKSKLNISEGIQVQRYLSLFSKTNDN